MNVTAFAKWTGTLLLLLTLGACGGSGDGDGGGGGGGGSVGGGAPPGSAVIGPAGGTVIGPNGASVVIPPGALVTNTTITITQTSAGSPAMPAGFIGLGLMFALTPHGTTFAVPVTVTIPFDPASVPAGVTPVLFKTNAQNQWEEVAGAAFGATSVTAQITSFSSLQTVERRDPIRLWTFEPDHEIATKGPLKDCTNLPAPLPSNCGEPLDLGGEIHAIRPFGTNGFLDFDGDDSRTLEAFSSADGVTFWVSAEDVGLAELRQSQKFIKLTDNATLRFVITKGLLEARDENQVPTLSECTSGLDLRVCHPLQAFIKFEAEARTPLGELLPDRNGAPALDTSGYLSLMGRRGLWDDLFVGRDPEHTTVAWKRSDFDYTRNADGGVGDRHPRARLIRSLVFNVDLSRLDVGDDFRVITTLRAYALNKRDRESAIGAYLRDPAKVGGGAMEFTGLLPVGDTAPAPVVERPAPPCTSGPDPAAGVLQFSAPTYALLESRFGGLNSFGIFVTRVQGSKGAVSATFTAGGGTAAPGVHYTPLTTTVHFGDGDTEPRLIDLDILQNTVSEPDTTVNLTLATPGGCAALGAPSSAVLTILDDDRLPPAPPPSGLDPSFGTDGKATATAFGGDGSAMALQADGKIVMVGGTFTDFILARFNADGSLDTSFGTSGGKVITDMGSGNRPEEATAVAIQPDGKIVVAGYTAIPNVPPAPRLSPTFALARYNTDGSLDTSFGTGGRVSGGVNGQAYAVAIQPDGKIVLAGEFSFDSTSGSDFSDFTVARFNANGSLDTSFGITASGQVATDIGTHTNSARNIVLQPDGGIVVSGGIAKVISSAPTPDGHTDIVRYTSNGSLDASFGVGGKLTLASQLVGEGLARQGDGKFVLVGSVAIGSGVTASTDFALMRLNADGRPDTSFGSTGTVTTAVSNERDAALAVALQADGKILVAGRTSNINTNFAVARYNIDGTLDTGFGNGLGVLTVDFFGFTDSAESVLVQPDGKIVLGGVARNNVDGYGLVRILP